MRKAAEKQTLSNGFYTGVIEEMLTSTNVMIQTGENRKGENG